MDQLPSHSIHGTAVVSAQAELGPGVRIGPYAIIGDRVVIGQDTVIGPHTVIQGPTRIGDRNRIYGQSSIGADPQDLKYQGEETSLTIGHENTIREFVTIHRGTGLGGGTTTLGNGSLVMTGAHIAHDCHVGNDTILANSATLAGHVEVADRAIVGAFSGVHQFCRVGYCAFIGGYSVITQDSLPFVKSVGQRNRARTYGINTRGLRRLDFSSEKIEALKRAYRWLFQKNLPLQSAIDQLRKENLETPEVRILIDFIQSSQRGFVR